MISFIVPGEPTAKGRARVYSRNGITRGVTPEKTVMYENLVKQVDLEEMLKRELRYSEMQLLEGALKMEVIAHFSIPKSIKGKKKIENYQKGKEFFKNTKNPNNTAWVFYLNIRLR